MGKLINQYKDLKSQDSKKIYLIKSGIFYIALEDDARFLSDKIGLKLTNINETTKKCGFPVSRLEYYKKIFDIANINYELIDTENCNVKIVDEDLNTIINKITKIDFDNITYKQAFDILQKLSNQIKQKMQSKTA